MRHLRPSFSSPRRAQGAGLIEVLIAVLVLAIGLLGIAAMQATALRNSQSALERSQGVVGMYSILDAMRANMEADPDGNRVVPQAYNTSSSCEPSGGGSGLIASDIQFWQRQLSESFGEEACGSIGCDVSNLCEITVWWDDTRGAGGVEELAFRVEAQL